MVLGVLCVVYAFNFVDRQIMSILTEPVKADLGLSDTQMGLLTGSLFALVYTVFGVPIGWFADRTRRVYVLAVSCAVWSLFTAGCGAAGDFLQLATARMGVGIGEAGGTAPSYSIISDYFAPDERALALAIFSLGVPIGMALGPGLGGTIARHLGWRAAFVIVGAIGIALAVMLALAVREPGRGAADGHAGQATEVLPLSTSIALFFKTPVLRMTFIATGLSGFVFYSVLNWTVPFLMRAKGITMANVALYYSIMLAVSIGAGMCLSGWIADRLSARHVQVYALIPAVASLAAIPFYLAFLYAPTWPLALAFLAVPSCLNIMYLAPAIAIVQNTASLSMRTTAGALLLLGINLIGLGLGPLFIGALSDWASPQPGGRSLQVALTCLTPVYLLAAGAHLLTARALKDTVQ